MLSARSRPLVTGLIAALAALAAPTAASAQGALDETFDVRARDARANPAQSSAARARVAQADPLTGGLAAVSLRDRFLTAASGAAPRSVALGYLRSHRDLFRLDDGDIASLELTRRYSWGGGTTHLQWAQLYRGIPSFDQGLRANVDADGRLINVGGAPRPDLAVESTQPGLGPRAALAAAGRHIPGLTAPGAAGPSTGPAWTTRFAGGQEAGLVLFGDSRDVRLAWRLLVYTRDGGMFDVVVSADRGTLLYRKSLVLNVDFSVFDHFPGAAGGGSQQQRAIPAAWLDGSGFLRGPNADVYADLNDACDNPVCPTGTGTEISPGVFPQDITFPGATPCPPSPTGCTWNSSDDGSWADNMSQAGNQLFFYVNNFHDYLRNTPGIDFGASSGNFEGGDRVQAQVNDGAALLDAGGCGTGYANNASMSTPPDGSPALMQMYLWTNDCNSGVRDVNGADDAHIVYHEYVHGLSSRLITDPSGLGALGGQGSQSGAMGEAWSDWYAEDYLAGAGFQTDTGAPGEIRSGTYENAAIRTQPFDCPVASGPPACPGLGGAGPGGYTYGDFGEILGFAEVHADGEIWVETLWDLRQALVGAHGGPGGVSRVRTLVTDGMRLAPDYPTFLQARDAILQADVLRGFGDRDRIWAVFAARGMGVNARTTGDGDTNPIQDFTTPPPLPPEDRTRPGVSRFTLSNVRFLVGLDRTPRAAQRRRRVRTGTDLPLPPVRGGQRGGDPGARPARPQGGPELP